VVDLVVSFSERCMLYFSGKVVHTSFGKRNN